MPQKPQIVVKTLQANQHRLADELVRLQLSSQVKRSGRGPEHPIWDARALLMKADPRMNTGFVLVAFEKNGGPDGKPIGYYLADFGFDRKTRKQAIMTAYAGVHPDKRSLGIGALLHKQAEKIALGNGIKDKMSTISPHNIPSLKVNLNKQGFNVSGWRKDCYGPGEHRFDIRGLFGAGPKKTPPQPYVSKLPVVVLDRDGIKDAMHRENPFLLELTTEHGDPRENELRHVDWDKFRGVHIVERDGENYLLMQPVVIRKQA